MQTQNPSLGNAQIVLNTHAEATFQIPDVTKVLAVPDLLKIYMEPAVAAIAQKIESDLLNLYAGFTANTPVGTPGTPITEATIDAAETALFLAKVPPTEQKFMVVDAATYSAWRQIPRFSEFQTAGDAGLRSLVDGTVGKIKDFFVFRSQFVPKTGSSPVTTHNMAFTKNASGPGGPPPAAAAAGYGRDRGVRRAGQFRHARGDELPAEYAGAAVHGGRAVRLRRAAQFGGRAGEHVGATERRARSGDAAARCRTMPGSATQKGERYGLTSVLPEDSGDRSDDSRRNFRWW